MSKPLLPSESSEEKEPAPASVGAGATWADCCGCAGVRVDVHTGSATIVEPFTVTPSQLAKLYQPGKDEENKQAAKELGYGRGICRALGVDPLRGIEGTPEDIAKRVQAFGENRLPEPPFESWWAIFFDCFKDAILIILLIASIVSLIIGSIEHPDHGWIDGLAIMIAVIIVASVTATNDYQKQLQFRALSNESKARVEVQVIRNGQNIIVQTWDLVVGDVVHVETGAKIPADGIVLRSSDFKTNESAVTGESDDISKDAVNDVIVLSGSKVAAGTCDFVVFAVGTRSMQGATIGGEEEPEDTPLQVKLDKLVQRISYLGIICSIGTFIAMMIIKGTGGVEDSWASWTLHAFLYAVTIIVVAIPEGLPLAVTISLAYSTHKMLADNNLIRQLAACETMGGATDICSDKTGTLTENRMTVEQAWLGGHTVRFPNTDRTDSPDASPNAALVPAPLRALLRDQLAMNSTATMIISRRGKREVKGSKTEGAGIMLVESMGHDVAAIRAQARDNASVVKQFSFSSERKMMTTMVALPNGGVRVFTTGGSDFVLRRCAARAMVSADGESYMTVPLTQQTSNEMDDVIVGFAKQALRTLGVAYRDFPSRDALPSNWMEEPPEDGLVLYAVLGIKDPLRRDVAEAVATVQRAGVTVRMVTGDNRFTATAIAKECGILKDGGIVMEGPRFRELTPAQVDELLPRLVVLARSSPKDKNILVRRLNGNLPRTREEWQAEHPDNDFDREHTLLLPGYYDEWAAARKHSSGNVYKAVVGVTGDGTNDVPALRAADVGLSMGISGTQAAMDASDIVILDDRFSSIVRAVLWGRSVFDNVQRFLQFQLTVNVTALVVTFLSAVMKQEPPLNPVMMLWVNLIMDTMGALALGTEEPTAELLDRKPYSATASLILPRMWRHIFAQSVLQLTMLLTLVVLAEERFGITTDFLNESKRYLYRDRPARNTDVTIYKSTFIFNAFVFCQLFNEFNSRSLLDDWQVWTAAIRNRMFVGIILVSIGLQALIVELGGQFTKTSGLVGMHWLYTILLGALSVPVGIAMRYIPVPARASDFAVYYQTAFYDAMNKRAASSAVVGAAMPGIDSTDVKPARQSAASAISPALIMPTAFNGPEASPAFTIPASGDPTLPHGSPLLGNPMSPTDELAYAGTGRHTGFSPMVSRMQDSFSANPVASSAGGL